MVAPIAKSLTCIDKSERMADAARTRLGKKARVVVGDLEAMPAPDASFDTVLALHVLASVRDPEAALREIARALRPGGRALVVTLDKHDHLDVAAPYGHVHAGFRPKRLARMLEDAGLEVLSCDVTSRERREPFFAVVTAVARKPTAEKKK
jgi:ArsR family transcriptional regulator